VGSVKLFVATTKKKSGFAHFIYKKLYMNEMSLNNVLDWLYTDEVLTRLKEVIVFTSACFQDVIGSGFRQKELKVGVSQCHQELSPVDDESEALLRWLYVLQGRLNQFN
jgi:hypothetical protein